MNLRDGGDGEGGSENLPDGPYRGVVDRFEEDLAVVLLERDGEEVGDVDVPVRRLPFRARRQDAVLRVVLRERQVASVWYDARGTRDRGASAQRRLNRLSEPAPRRPPESTGREGGESGDEGDDAEE